MPLHIDYYASLNSPWTHLGAARIEGMAHAAGASMRIYPVDFGTIFPASGGLPLPKRAPQRQAYRLQELQRWRDHLGIPITIQPKHFPSPEALSSACVIAVRETMGDQPAIKLAHAVLKGADLQDSTDRFRRRSRLSCLPGCRFLRPCAWSLACKGRSSRQRRAAPGLR